MFEMTISVGNLLTIAGFIVFVTIYIVNGRNIAKNMGLKFEFYEATVEDFKVELRKLQEVVTEQALQSARLDSMDQRMLSQGQRFDRFEERINFLLNGRFNPRGGNSPHSA